MAVLLGVGDADIVEPEAVIPYGVWTICCVKLYSLLSVNFDIAVIANPNNGVSSRFSQSI